MSYIKKPAYYVHENGFIMPEAFPVEGFKTALDYSPDPDDVFICTYPKCGTTWVQCILHLMRNKGKPLEREQSINDFVPHLEEVGKATIESLPRPRVIKTHLPYSLVPKSSSARYIYIARNPKDCCVSFYHHTKGFPKYYFEDGTFDEFFELFLKGDVDFGDYFDNLLSWFERRNDPNVLFLLYEDMKLNIAECVVRIGEFLGGEFRQACDEASVLEAVLQKSSFDCMKETPQNWSSKRAEGSAGFIRKGEVGDWKRYFSEEQSRLLDIKFINKLSGTGAESLWQNYDI